MFDFDDRLRHFARCLGQSLVVSEVSESYQAMGSDGSEAEFLVISETALLTYSFYLYPLAPVGDGLSQPLAEVLEPLIQLEPGREHQGWVSLPGPRACDELALWLGILHSYRLVRSGGRWLELPAPHVQLLRFHPR